MEESKRNLEKRWRESPHSTLFRPSYSQKTSTGNELVKAQNIINSKELGDDGVIVQMVVWHVQQPLKGSAHTFKYRLYCGRKGKCLVRYDNEDGKGDHRHYGDREEAYPYVSLEQLILDFLNDVKRMKR